MRQTWFCSRHGPSDGVPCQRCADEAAIRADERARVEAEIVAWLDSCGHDPRIIDAIEQGAHRPKGERG